uniref:Uncharacterized protein n=1 Tax=Anguilla anguilla TaxID=7936 RepID=A0A0E9TM06_ANGAN
MQFLYQGVLKSTLLVSQRTRCSVSIMMKRWKMTRKRFFCSLCADSTFSCSRSICSSS